MSGLNALTRCLIPVSVNLGLRDPEPSKSQKDSLNATRLAQVGQDFQALQNGQPPEVQKPKEIDVPPQAAPASEVKESAKPKIRVEKFRRVNGLIPLIGQVPGLIKCDLKADPDNKRLQLGTLQIGSGVKIRLEQSEDEKSYKLSVDSNGNGVFDDEAAQWGKNPQGLYMGQITVKMNDKDFLFFVQFPINGGFLYGPDYALTKLFAVEPGKRMRLSIVEIDRTGVFTWPSWKKLGKLNVYLKEEDTAGIARLMSPLDLIRLGDEDLRIINISPDNEVTFAVTKVDATTKPTHKEPLKEGDEAIGLAGQPIILGTHGKDEVFSFEEVRGKVVVYDFWAKYCQPCLASFPDYVALLQDKDLNPKDYAVIGVNLDSGMSEADLAKELANSNATVPFRTLQYVNGNAFEDWGFPGIPFVCVVDGDTKKVLAMGPELADPEVRKRKLQECIANKAKEKE